MGGYFSTRWNWERTRLDTAGLLRLDVRHMQRAGVLQPGARSTWQWTRGDGEHAGTIVTIMDRDRPRLTLDYSTRRTGETDWTPRRVPVWLDATPCHYGRTPLVPLSALPGQAGRAVQRGWRLCLPSLSRPGLRIDPCG